jgi:chorismate mutase
VCKLTAKVGRIKAKLSKRDRAVIEDLLHKWAHESTDATYYRMKLEGTWP